MGVLFRGPVERPVRRADDQPPVADRLICICTPKQRILRAEVEQEATRGCWRGNYARIMGNVCSSGPTTENHSSQNEDVENGGSRDKQQRKQLQRIPTFSKVHARLREDCKVRDAYKIGKTYVLLRSCYRRPCFVLRAVGRSGGRAVGRSGAHSLLGSIARADASVHDGPAGLIAVGLSQKRSLTNEILLVGWGRVDFRW